TLVMASSQLWKTASDVNAVWPLRGPTTLIARSPQSPISHPPKLPHRVDPCYLFQWPSDKILLRLVVDNYARAHDVFVGAMSEPTRAKKEVAPRHHAGSKSIHIVLTVPRNCRASVIGILRSGLRRILRSYPRGHYRRGMEGQH